MGNAYGHIHHKPDGSFSTLISPPAAPIVLLDEAKAHCRVDHDDDDDLVTRLVEVATDYLDGPGGVTGRALITQRWQETMARFPSQPFIILPVGPVQQVISVAYYDADGVDQTVANDQFRVIVNGDYALIELVDGATWPGTQSRSDAVRVQYDTGYGDTSADIPEAIRHAALLMVGHWYENREAVTDYAVNQLPMAVQTLLINKRDVLGMI